MPKLVLKINCIGMQTRGFDIVFEWLESIGLSFRNAAANAVTMWTEDGQITTTVAAVVESARQRQSGSVQMWFDAGNDINLSWAADGMTMFLDGITEKQRKGVVHVIIDHLMDAYARFRNSWHVRVGTEGEMLGAGR